MARKKAEPIVEVSNSQVLTDVERRKRLDLVMANLAKKKNNMVVGRLSDPKVQEQLNIRFIKKPKQHS